MTPTLRGQFDLTDRRLDAVTPEAVRAYVVARGWQPYSHPVPRLWAHPDFVDDAGEPIPQVVPLDRSEDFATRLEELLRALAGFEGREGRAVLEDVLALQASPPVGTGADAARTPSAPPVAHG